MNSRGIVAVLCIVSFSLGIVIALAGVSFIHSVAERPTVVIEDAPRWYPEQCSELYGTALSYVSLSKGAQTPFDADMMSRYSQMYLACVEEYRWTPIIK